MMQGTMGRRELERQKRSGYRVPPSREGKRFIGGYYDPAVAKELKIIAANEDISIQEIIGKAIELFLRNRGIIRAVVEKAGK